MRQFSGRSALLIALIVVCTAVMATAGGAGEPATPEVADDIRLELVEWARLAQNAHNFQSWSVVLDPARDDRMTLYLSGERMLPETDPPARQTTISAGTFLAVVEARAAALGYRAEIDVLPDGEPPAGAIPRAALATITVVPDSGAEARFPVAADVDAITRPTVKYSYRPATLSDELIQRIERYSTDGITFRVITDPAEVAWISDRSVEAFTVEMENEATLMETYNATRETGRERREQPYGLAYTANFSPFMTGFIGAWSRLFPQSPEAYAASGIKIFTRSMDDVTAYITVVTDDNTRSRQIETGMRLQAAWMELHRSGHVALPNSQALQEYAEMAELYELVHERYAPDGETVQMVLAVAQPGTWNRRHSPRLAVEDIVFME